MNPVNGKEGVKVWDENECLQRFLLNDQLAFEEIIKHYEAYVFIVPGAGHMYLGLLKQGAQFMAAFFFFLFMSGWLHLEILVFVLPVIWFYSLFDAYHLLEEESEGLRPDESPLFGWLDQHPGWLGWSLIILGVIIILQRIITPVFEFMLNPALRNYIETGVVALILIAGGVVLLNGTKKLAKKEDESCDNGE